MNTEQMTRMSGHRGFVAALDQSGGSTPKALEAYGIPSTAYKTEEEMFDLVHKMRTRIVTSPAFSGDRILGAILFENTMDREVGGEATPDFLWNRKRIVPFLKIDLGLEKIVDAVQVMKPIPGLATTLQRAKAKNIFGTKMRSVIHGANPGGIAEVVAQQFDFAREIAAAGLVPIIEPEVNVRSHDKRESEDMLLREVLRQLEALPAGVKVMFKFSIPEVDDFYAGLMRNDRVLRIVALSGGYSRHEANEKLGRNHGLIASFSRALAEGLSAMQSDDEFNAALAGAVEEIYQASIT